MSYNECKACQKPITRVRINKLTGTEEELCSECLAWAMASLYDMVNDEDDEDFLDGLYERRIE
jgi:hypothetical protein